jgi:Uma2 family endonuclease
MAIRTPTPPVDFDDRDYYPLHEEDDVPEIPRHKVQTTGIYDVLRTRLPGRFVTGNVCIYWARGNRRLYRAPDVFVAESSPDDPEARVYLTWRDPPIHFAAEVGSRSTFRTDEGPKQEIYERHVRAREYLYFNHPVRDLRLWRMGPDGYELVTPEANGRLRSAELELEFGIDEAGFLRIYTLDGELLRTHPEEAQQRRMAEERAAEEARRRQEAEERAAEEARQRREAEERARQAEAGVAEELTRRQALERELAALRAQLRDRDA